MPSRRPPTPALPRTAPPAHALIPARTRAPTPAQGPDNVISSTLENPEWNNTQVLRGDIAEEVRKLTQQYERDIVVHGSPQLAQTLIEHDLVDELRLMVYPVIVGAGRHFFTTTTAKKNLRLVETRTFNDGIHVLVYRPA